MGNCPEAQPASQEEYYRSREIERILRKGTKEQNEEIKILLLGAGDSGKSTIAKQIRLIYLSGFTDQERANSKETIFTNIALCLHRAAVRISCAGLFETLPSQIQETVSIFLTEDVYSTCGIEPQMWPTIQHILKNDVFRDAIIKDEGQSESIHYFLDSVHRLAEPSYCPTNQDLLYTRTKTTGIRETRFKTRDTHFNLVDVGGQRSERKKWIHSFQDVAAYVFCVAISEFNMSMEEEPAVNRLQEAIFLFDEVVNCSWLDKAGSILFLNKFDLFQEKIMNGTDLKSFFPDYDGEVNPRKAAQYITNMFQAIRKNKTIHVHTTTATSTELVEMVFKDVTDVLLREAMRSIGL
eukprot:TRINITY_DN14061_c0_g1_i1.p1 TRINITY_DN14061_c0_g1~~TRINITY_DN14061_c0_g1_i1.p1  ORF type:complete len:352 (-),score=40.27 TRINITY_DN14061_c0_g1_i1:93-1148(-)